MGLVPHWVVCPEVRQLVAFGPWQLGSGFRGRYECFPVLSLCLRTWRVIVGLGLVELCLYVRSALVE